MYNLDYSSNLYFLLNLLFIYPGMEESPKESFNWLKLVNHRLDTHSGGTNLSNNLIIVSNLMRKNFI